RAVVRAEQPQTRRQLAEHHGESSEGAVRRQGAARVPCIQATGTRELTMKTRSTLAAIVIVCCGLSGSAQQAPQNPRPAFRSGVELVSLGVGVVANQGQPGRHLSAGEFTVTV